MANDDLDQFPTPPQAPDTAPIDTPPVEPAEEPHFEATPDEIPSVISNQAPSFETTPVEPAATFPSDSFSSVPPVSTPPSIPPEPVAAKPSPEPATMPQTQSSPIAPIIFIVLLFITIGAVAGVVFLANQTTNLKNQLTEITQTLQNQQVATTPTPSPSPVSSEEITPTAIITPVSTISATPTPSNMPTGAAAKPLSIASTILQTAIKHSPNAQLILIKTENATDALKVATKYFFRVDLTTKKYFYILVDSKGTPQVVDKQIYVTPDDNIPSLNDAILTNLLGIDLDEAITLANAQCTDKVACAAASVKGQYIKSGTTTIWQITMTVAGQTQPYVVQIDVDSKAIVYKSANFTAK